MPIKQTSNRIGRAGRWIIALCCAAQFLVVLDVTIVNVALPSIQHALHLSEQDQQWIINAYALTFAGFLMLGARAGDLFGRRRILVLGIGLFTAFSFLGGVATSGEWVIVARAGQGLGAAILAPGTLSLLTSTFSDPDQRRRALGAWSTVAAVGAAAGLVAGGVLAQFLPWQWIFLAKVPIGIALITATLLIVEKDGSRVTAAKLDVAGGLTLTAGLTAVVYGIANAGQNGWGATATLEPIVIGIALLLIFTFIEARWASQPLIPLGFFRSRTLAIANGVSAVTGASLFGMYYFVSLYLQNVNGYSALVAGLAFAPAGIATTIGALTGTRLVNKLGARRLLLLGLGTATAGFAWLSFIIPGAGYATHLLGPLVLIGLGLGTSFVPSAQEATAAVPASDAGLASGLFTTSRQLGSAVGLAAMATIASSLTGASQDLPESTALGVGYAGAFVAMTGVLCVGLVLAFLFPRRAPTTPDTVTAGTRDQRTREPATSRQSN